MKIGIELLNKRKTCISRDYKAVYMLIIHKVSTIYHHLGIIQVDPNKQTWAQISAWA